MTGATHSGSVSVRGGRFTVATSGFADGPAQPLVRYLNDRGAAAVTMIQHPLVLEGPAEHRVTYFEDGEWVRTRELKRPSRPPYTYVLDPITPAKISRCDAWIGFNCLVTAQGLLMRRLGVVRRVVHWNVDFVPDRFGSRAMTRAYEWLDRQCCVRADGRVELSDAAFRGRLDAYHLDAASCPAELIPMGSWTAAAPKTSVDRLAEPHLVFLGHVVERMGLPLLLDVVEILRGRGRYVHTDVIGSGPALPGLQADAQRRGLSDAITWHGFIAEFADVERILAAACVALAPYETSGDSFSRFADPGKLKAYLGAGLPIVLTDVPPNARDLADHAGASVVPPDAHKFVDAIEELLDDPRRWEAGHHASLEYSRRFDWATMFDGSLPRVGLDVEVSKRN